MKNFSSPIRSVFAIGPLLMILGASRPCPASNRTSQSPDQTWQALSLKFKALAQLEPPSGRYSALWRLHQHGELFRSAGTLLGQSEDSFGKELIKTHLSPCTSLRETCQILLQPDPRFPEPSRLLRRACKTCRLAESGSSAWTIFHSVTQENIIRNPSFRDELIDSSLRLTASIDRLDTALLRIYLKSLTNFIAISNNLDQCNRLEKIAQFSGLANGFSKHLPPGILVKDMTLDSLQMILKNYCPTCTTFSLGGSKSFFPNIRWWRQYLDPTTLAGIEAYQTIVTSSHEDFHPALIASFFILEKIYPHTPNFYTAYFPLDGSIKSLLKRRYREIYRSNYQNPYHNTAFAAFALEYLKKGRDMEFKRHLKSCLCKFERKFPQICKETP